MNTLAIINDVYQLIKNKLRDKVILSKEDSEDLQQNIALWTIDLLRIYGIMTPEDIYKKLRIKIHHWINKETYEIASSNIVYKMNNINNNNKANDTIYNLSIGKTLDQLVESYTNQIITKYCECSSYKINIQIFLLHIYGFTFREISKYFNISLDYASQAYKLVVNFINAQY